MPMRIEIINTGRELLLGRVLNTHQQWLGRQLANLGYAVDRQLTVDDCAPDIEEAVREALQRTDLVIMTGGLGPTSDDRTRDVIASLLGRPLREDADVLANIERFFAARKRSMPPTTRVQALVPEGATVLMNAHGTAPGLALEGNPRGEQASAPRLIMLPGPPRELHPMFAEQVAPLIRKWFPLEGGLVVRTLKTTGLGESLVEAKIAQPLQPLVERGLELGYCARVGEVDVRFAARGAKAGELVAEAEGIARGLLGDLIFSTDDEQLEAVIVRLLAERQQTIALAESCTGGFIAHRLTNIPGASAVLLAGLVTYSNQAKQQFLGVRAETLAAHGAVSQATAREMADGARARTGSDYAVAVTGIAGPGGGTPEKPVGTVWMAVASAAGTVTRGRVNAFDRETFKYVTSQQALELLRRTVLGLGQPS